MPKLAVDRQIEESKVSAPTHHLQANTDRPDLFEFEWDFWLPACPYPRFAMVGVKAIVPWRLLCWELAFCNTSKVTVIDPLSPLANGRYRAL